MNQTTITIQHEPVKKTNSYFEWIDILRGIAALGVVLFHARVDLWVGWQAIRLNPEKYTWLDQIMSWLSIPLPFLGSSVMLFFILSGFCIHYPSARLNSIHLKSYFLRRFLRIYPPFLAAVLLSVLTEGICYLWLSQSRSPSLTIWRTISMVQNYPPSPGQLISNPSLWSLPVEAELYIFYPLIFWINQQIGGKWAFFIVSLLTLLGLYLTLNVAHWLAGNFLDYWIIWCSGAVLAQLTQTKKLPAWSNGYFIPMILAFTLSCILVINNTPYTISNFSWAIGYFLLLWFILTLPSPTSLLPKFLLNPMLWLGKISFSLYLIHFPLFRLWGLMWVNTFGDKPANLLICLLSSVLAIFISGCFYEIIEKPSHKLARWAGKIATKP